MFGRRRAEGDRRRLNTQIQGDGERRRRRTDRRSIYFERRYRTMDRRQGYDEFWMGARDRRLRIMDRRKKGSL